MKIAPADLENNGYTLLEALHHKELIPFVQTTMKRKSIFATLYLVFVGLSLAWVGGLFGYGLGKDLLSLGDLLMWFGLGIPAAFLLMPLHEGIHALAYRWVGASHVSFDANWKKLYFMALADRFVASYRELIFVAIAPFVVISILLISISIFVPFSIMMFLGGTLAAHTSMCTGDFAIMGFMSLEGGDQVVTYDDVPNQVSYFYRRAA